jgi:NADH dehydrogenase [ubiquinone] 1 alpha subcomplex assembly factor 7
MERLDAFMARANAAFYAQGDALSHFTTAPEISQAFGECLGLWAAVTWQQMGAPAKFVLAELGPGRGTLMADAWRAVRGVMPEFCAAADIALVETSPSLMAMQARALAGAPVRWFPAPEALPEGPAIILANEFLDALPIRQFVRRGSWMERFVADGAFVEQPTDAPLPEAPEGSILERCEPALSIAAALGARLAEQGGAALIIDYGPAESGFGDTLQAIRHHARAEPLAEPGSADLTAHVDFAALARAAAPATAHGPMPMGLFLQRLGLMSRAAILARSAPAQAGMILSGAQRLTLPEQMGRLFKALCLCHPSLPTPAGFSE